MSRIRREGLRRKLPPAPKAKTSLSASQRAKLWREALKLDPIRYEEQKKNDAERNRRNRQRPKTEEEKAKQREASRLRMQKSRAKRKAEKAAEARSLQHRVPTTPEKYKTRSVVLTSKADIEAKRKTAREQKRKERANWSAQKWRRHREKNRAAYHARKAKNANFAGQDVPASALSCPSASSSTPPVVASAETVQSNSPLPDCSQVHGTPNSTPPKHSDAARRKAKSRLKKILGDLGISLEQVKELIEPQSSQKSSPKATPESKKIKNTVNGMLETLKPKRDKKSLSKRKLLFKIVHPDQTVLSTSPYKRKKMHEGTESAIRYMEEVAVPLPGKSTVSKKTLSQMKVLPKRLKRLHRDFKTAQPYVKSSLRSMYRHRPSHIKTSQQQAFRQGLCEVCTNIDLKLDSLNPYLEKQINGRDILSELSVCSPPSMSCLNRNCSQCGTELAKRYIKDNLTCASTTHVKWYSWDMVKRETGQRKDKVENEGTIEELVNILLGDLTTYSKHVFVYRWQYKEHKALLTKLPSLPKTAVAVFDFAENHLCKYQDEVHSAHWGYKQVTVHPSVLYYACLTCSELVTDYLVFLSDDLSHDSHMVDVILTQTKQHLHEEAGTEHFIIWSDGCAAQYKSKLPFYYLSQSPDVERAYFGSLHGKSPCDSCGGVIKTLVDQDVKGEKLVIQNAQKMYDHLTQRYTLPDPGLPAPSCVHTKRSFCLIQPGQIDRSLPSSALKTVPGTRQIHSLRGLGNNKISTRNLSCYCDPCLGLENPGSVCMSRNFVEDWEEKHIAFTKSGKEFSTSTHEASPSPVHAPFASPSHPCQFYRVPSQLAQEEDLRMSFFESIQERMVQAETYSELQIVCKDATAHAMEYSLPGDQQHYLASMSKVSVDSVSLNLLPEDAPQLHFPVNILGDGNCLPRTVSMLAFGDDSRHVEVRVRLVIEMVTHFELYLCPEFLSKGSSDDGDHILEKLKLYSENGVSHGNNSSALEDEIFIIRKPSQECGMWHLFAAANILQSALTVVFPDKGEDYMRSLAKRTILPDGDQLSTKFIMWTTHREDQTDEHWAPTHFVPLLPLHPSSDEPSVVEMDVGGTTQNADILLESMFDEPATVTDHVPHESAADDLLHELAIEVPVKPAAADVSLDVDEFYMLRWQDGKDYVCEVKELLSDEGVVLVDFMVEHEPGLFCWDKSKDGSSWENLEMFIQSSRRVSIELNELRSTQRRQLYNLLD